MNRVTDPTPSLTYTSYSTYRPNAMLNIYLRFSHTRLWTDAYQFAEFELFGWNWSCGTLPWLTIVYLFTYFISVEIASESWTSYFFKNEVVGKGTCHYWCWNKSAIFMLRSFRSACMFHSDYLTMNVYKELFYYCDFIISAWLCNCNITMYLHTLHCMR